MAALYSIPVSLSKPPNPIFVKESRGYGVFSLSRSHTQPHIKTHFPDAISEKFTNGTYPEGEGRLDRGALCKGRARIKNILEKGEASAWAAERETELRKQMATGIVAGKTVRDAFHKYEKEVSKTKRGYRWETIRMAFVAEIEIGEDNDRVKFGGIKLSELKTMHQAQLRDERLKNVKGSTINRDLNLLSNVFAIARDEWHWIAQSPTTKVRRRKDPPARDRRPTDDETECLCFAIGLDEATVTTKNQATAIAWLFAIETAMRPGEMCKLLPEYFEGPVAHLGPFTSC